MDHVARHLMKLYGIDDAMPTALQFPRLPPGVGNLPHPLMPRPFVPPQGIIPKETIDDYSRMLQKNVTGLLDMAYPGAVPPGHPLYNRQPSLEVLRAENSKLRAENSELKKQLDGMSADRPHDAPG